MVVESHVCVDVQINSLMILLVFLKNETDEND